MENLPAPTVAPHVAFDWETFLMRPGLLAPPPVCLTWGTEADHRIAHARDLSAYDVASALELEGEKRIVGAHLAFDLAVACARWPELVEPVFAAYEAGRCRDVLIDQKLVDNAHGRLGGFKRSDGVFVEYRYSLADVERRVLERDRSAEKKGTDAWRVRYAELFAVPLELWPPDARRYALEDTEGASAVYTRQEEAYSAVLVDAPRQAYASWALYLITCWGLRTDPDNIEVFRREVEDEFHRCRKLLVEAGLVRDGINPKTGRPFPKSQQGSRDTKAAQARMAAVMAAQGKRPKMTDGGEKSEPQISLDADACADSGDEILEAYAELSSIGSVVKDHIPALLRGVEAPIQPDFNSPLETGRTSCKGPDTGRNKPRTWCPKQGLECIAVDAERRWCIRCGELLPKSYGFQVQNPRKKGPLRECFVARPGMVYVDADYTGLELCTVAQVCILAVGFSELGNALNGGLDAHLALAAELLGISYEEAKYRRGQGDKEVGNARQTAKVANFGFPGGLGVDGFLAFAKAQYGVVLSYEEAAALKAGWKRRWPEFDAYFDWIKGLGEPIHLVQFFTGRERGMCSFTQAANGFFQALGADVAKRGLCAVSRACYADRSSVLFGTRPVNFIHDQIVAETKEEREHAHRAAFELARIMVDAGNELLPDVPVRCVPALSKHWTKDAAAVFDAPPADGGLLVPWDLAHAGRWKVWNEDGEIVKWK